MAGAPEQFVSLTSTRRLASQALDQAREIQELRHQLFQGARKNGNGRH